MKPSPQGGHYYSSTSLIDGFYTIMPFHTHITCTTLLHQNQNSDHYPINLDLSVNTQAQKVDKLTRHTPRITYPIPLEKIQKIHIQFQKAINLATQSLVQKLHTPHLHHTEWEEAQENFQDIINTLSTCIEETYLNTQILPTTWFPPTQATEYVETPL